MYLAKVVTFDNRLFLCLFLLRIYKKDTHPCIFQLLRTGEAGDCLGTLTWAIYIIHCNDQSAVFVNSTFRSKVKIKEVCY